MCMLHMSFHFLELTTPNFLRWLKQRVHKSWLKFVWLKMFMSIESTIKGSSSTNTDGKGHECGKCNAKPWYYMHDYPYLYIHTQYTRSLIEYTKYMWNKMRGRWRQKRMGGDWSHMCNDCRGSVCNFGSHFHDLSCFVTLIFMTTLLPLSLSILIIIILF